MWQLSTYTPFPSFSFVFHLRRKHQPRPQLLSALFSPAVAHRDIARLQYDPTHHWPSISSLDRSSSYSTRLPAIHTLGSAQPRILLGLRTCRQTPIEKACSQRAGRDSCRPFGRKAIQTCSQNWAPKRHRGTAQPACQGETQWHAVGKARTTVIALLFQLVVPYCHSATSTNRQLGPDPCPNLRNTTATTFKLARSLQVQPHLARQLLRLLNLQFNAASAIIHVHRYHFLTCSIYLFPP